MPMTPRYTVRTVHGEGATVYHALDTFAPDTEQPSIVRSWSSRTEPRAHELALDWVRRHNALAAPDNVPNYYSDRWDHLDRCCDCGVLLSEQEQHGDRCRCCTLYSRTR